MGQDVLNLLVARGKYLEVNWLMDEIYEIKQSKAEDAINQHD